MLEHLDFSSTGSKGSIPNLFHDDSTSVLKASLLKMWFAKVSVEELKQPAESPDLNELDQQMLTRPSCPMSVPDLTNALVLKWAQATVQNLVGHLSTRVEPVIAAKGRSTPHKCPWFRYGMFSKNSGVMIRYPNLLATYSVPKVCLNKHQTQNRIKIC